MKLKKDRKLTEKQVETQTSLACTQLDDLDPRVETLVNDLIGRVADKWTMLVLEVLAEKGELRFTRLSELVVGISQKMLTQTLRLMERDGLITRTVHPVVPPKGRIQTYRTGLQPWSSFLRCLDVGREKPHRRGEGTQRFR